MQLRDVVILSVCLLITFACTEESPPPPVEAPAQGSAPIAHGDHNPHHGGLVFMHGDLHFETVLNPEGHHRVFFSDAIRDELPAAVASEVTLRVLRPDEEPEALELEIDEFGESWEVSGRPVEDLESKALVRFVVEGAPYEMELPFLAESVDSEADPHQSMGHP